MSVSLLWLKRGLILSGLLMMLLPLPERVSMGVFAFLLILFGIPHGALDHVLFRNQYQGNAKKLHLVFYSYYFVWIGIYAALWWVLPGLAMAGFLLVSAYHFGQTQLTHLAAPKWGQLIWGGWVVAWLIYTHPEALQWGFSDVFPTLALERFLWVMGWLAVGLAALSAAMLLHLVGRNWQLLGLELLEMGVIAGLFATTNFYLSFGLFFGGWHALRALQNLRQELLRATTENLSIQRLLWEALPHSVGSILGISILTVAAYYTGISSKPALFLFMGLSVVAMPHIALVERWNRFLRAVPGATKKGAYTPPLSTENMLP